MKTNLFFSAPTLIIIVEKELGKKSSPPTIRNVLHRAKKEKSYTKVSEIRQKT